MMLVRMEGGQPSPTSNQTAEELVAGPDTKEYMEVSLYIVPNPDNDV